VKFNSARQAELLLSARRYKSSLMQIEDRLNEMGLQLQKSEQGLIAAADNFYDVLTTELQYKYSPANLKQSMLKLIEDPNRFPIFCVSKA